MDCNIRRTKKNPNDYVVHLTGLTRGSLLALKNALDGHAARGSAIAGDLSSFVVAGIKGSGDHELVQSVLEAPELSAACGAAVTPATGSGT